MMKLFPATGKKNSVEKNSSVMVTCCEYGMEVSCPSQAIKLLAPRPSGTLRFALGEAKIASIAIQDLENGVIRDMWIPIINRLETRGISGADTDPAGDKCSEVCSNLAMQSGVDSSSTSK